MKKSKTFRVSFSGSTVLSTEDIWPDGDWPDDPKVEDVVAVICESVMTPHELIKEWNLDDDVEVWVDDGKQHSEVGF